MKDKTELYCFFIDVSCNSFNLHKKQGKKYFYGLVMVLHLLENVSFFTVYVFKFGLKKHKITVYYFLNSSFL